MSCEETALEGAAITSGTSTVTVRNLAGAVLAIVSPAPADVTALRSSIEEHTGVAPALQKFLPIGGTRALEDGDTLGPEVTEVQMVVDETPMFTWDHASNPNRDMLSISENTVKCPGLKTDYINVITQEPVRKGVHYYQFHMHYIGDEQWCGVMSDPSQAGSRYSGRSLKAWSYYCGRMGARYSSIRDGLGALHAEGRAVAEFEKLKPRGDVIGMLVDLEKGAIAFELNGRLQGACAIPTGKPLWVFTHVDRPDDHVELVKLALPDAPQESIQALGGALLDVAKGEFLRGIYRREVAEGSEEE